MDKKSIDILADTIGEYEVKVSVKRPSIYHAIRSSIDSVEFFQLLYDEDTIEYTESVYALFLDRRNSIICWKQISSGGMIGSVVDVHVIATMAIKIGSKGVVLSHNHPSGNKSPSQSDIALTDKLKKALSLIDVNLLDHIILTKDSFSSFADEGLI